MNPELAAILAAADSQYEQVRLLDAALTANKRIKAKRVANSSTPQSDVWATGTLFRDAALNGAFTFQGVEIIGYGVTSDLTTCLPADVSTGISVMRIEGGEHWIEGRFGLQADAEGNPDIDFTFPTNPTATNSIAIAGTFRLRANQALPDGTPDTIAPTITLSVPSNTVTVAGPFVLTANVSDNVGVASVSFYCNGALLGTRNSAPWAYTETIPSDRFGTFSYTAIVSDAAGNSTTSAAQSVTVDIVETGPATAIGSELTTISMQNTDASTQTNIPVTFGQVFSVGALPATDAAVELRAPNNSIVPCQLDVKATHQDGSVRHAIISAVLPSLGASESRTFSILRKASPIGGAAAIPSDFSGLNAVATIVDTGTDAAGPNAGTTYTADAAPLLAAGTYETWLSGPVASEWIVRAPLKTDAGVEHPHLHARFNIRAYKGQAKAKIDYTIENTWAKPKAVMPVTVGASPWEDVSNLDLVYAVSLHAGTQEVYTRASNGYTVARFNYNSNGTYDGNATGIPNNATVYTATIIVDGVSKSISVVGSSIQTYGALISQLNTQLGGAATVNRDASNLGIKITSATTGANSSVIVNRGTLFPALMHDVIYRPIRGDEIIHYSRTRWKKTLWWNTTAPAVHIAHNTQYLISTKAVPNYDPTLTGSPETIAANKAKMAGNSDFNQAGISKGYWPDVGYAPQIGILPEWQAMYLVNGGKDAKDIMLGMADLGGGWSTHTREYDTDKPLQLSKWPYVTFSPNATDSRNPATNLNEKLPTSVSNPAIPPSGNSPDIAHHPDLYFVPYLVTGDHWYMEGMAFMNRYTCLVTNPGATLRDGRKCLWRVEQGRGQGWMIRTAAHAAYLLPDNYPIRADITYTIQENAEWYRANYIDPAGQYHNKLGVMHHNGFGYGDGVSIALWMDDHLTSATGRAVELGIKQLMPWFEFKAKCPVGRMTSGPDFCWQLATLYKFAVRAQGATSPYETWGEVYQASIDELMRAATCGSQEMANAIFAADSTATTALNSMIGRPDYIGGYPANLQPALAYAETHKVSNADNGWLVYSGRSVKQPFNQGPQFAIVPRA
jgi:hypothetical protein